MIEVARRQLDAPREQQLSVLGERADDQNLRKSVSPPGRPVTGGWMSSYYGRAPIRSPASAAMHKGVDFAGKRRLRDHRGRRPAS